MILKSYLLYLTEFSLLINDFSHFTPWIKWKKVQKVPFSIKQKCSMSVRNSTDLRWTCSSPFIVRKLMFESVRCSIKWCSTHHYLKLNITFHIDHYELCTLLAKQVSVFWVIFQHDWDCLIKSKVYFCFLYFLMHTLLNCYQKYQHRTSFAKYIIQDN